MKSLQSFIILVEDVINIIRDALDLEVGRLAVPQEVSLALLAAPALVVHVAATRLSRVAIARGRHLLLPCCPIGILSPILEVEVISFEFGPTLIIEIFDLVLIKSHFLGDSIELRKLILKLLHRGILLLVVDVVLVDLQPDAFEFFIELEVLGLVDLAVDLVHLLFQHLLHGAQLLRAALVEELLFLHLLQVGPEVWVSITVLFGLRAQGELEVEVLSFGRLWGWWVVPVEFALDHLGLLGEGRRRVLVVSNWLLLVFLIFLTLYVGIDLLLQSLVLLPQFPLLLLLPAGLLLHLQAQFFLVGVLLAGLAFGYIGVHHEEPASEGLVGPH